MPSRDGVQYTIRGIPKHIDKALRRRAHQRRISLNQLLVQELQNAVNVTGERTYRSLKTVAGRWVEDPEFDRIIEEQRQIDWSLWR